MLLALGQFIFSTDNLCFSQIQRSRKYSYAANAVADGRDDYQYTGVGEDALTIPFVIYEAHGLGSRQAIEDLAEMASSGAGYVLIDGAGYIYGVYAIDSIDDTRSFITTGGLPQKIDGTLKLVRVDDERIAGDKTPEGAQNLP